MADYLKKQGYLTVSATNGMTPSAGTQFDTVADQIEQTAKRAQVKEAALPARSPNAYVNAPSIGAISSDGVASKHQPTSQTPIEKPLVIDRLADLLFGVRRDGAGPKGGQVATAVHSAPKAALSSPI